MIIYVNFNTLGAPLSFLRLDTDRSVAFKVFEDSISSFSSFNSGWASSAATYEY